MSHALPSHDERDNTTYTAASTPTGIVPTPHDTDVSQHFVAHAVSHPAGPLSNPTPASLPYNTVLHGDCLTLLPQFPAASVDLIVTDPPYLVRYVSRDGRSLANDHNDFWLRPAFAALYRVLRPDCFCLSFYGWHKADVFLSAWRAVGFRPVGHFVFIKRYHSKRGFTAAHHESAYLLAKGSPRRPATPPRDVLSWRYTGNYWHPTQKPLTILRPLIWAYSRGGDLVLDPFAGSGSTALAARQLGRRYLAIEKDAVYYEAARQRLAASLPARLVHQEARDKS